MLKVPELFPIESAVVKDYDAASKQWKEESIKVQIEKRPFACGAMRYVLVLSSDLVCNCDGSSQTQGCIQNEDC
jgi:hypothetical protein